MIDSHCHLNHPQFAGDRAEVLDRARSAGVTAMVVVGFDMPSSEAVVELSAAEPDVWATVGIHPHDASTYNREAERRLREMAANPKVVAIGEIGLDYHYNHSPRDVQLSAFRAQLTLAREVGLPVVIHCREGQAGGEAALSAHDDVFAECDRLEGGAQGVMHCWSGSVSQARRAVTIGMHIGIAGVVTFKNRGEIGDVALAVPEDCLLIETDAPYLAPVPFRGRRNEPAFVAHVCARLAEDLGHPPEHIARVTASNAARLFSRRLSAEC